MNIQRAILFNLLWFLWCVIAGGDGLHHVWADELAWERLTQDGTFKMHPRWSPDGKELVYALQQEERIRLMLQPVTPRGAPRPLTRREEPEFEAAWSPDGTKILFSGVRLMGPQGDVDIMQINRDGSDLKILITTPGLFHEESACWSCDGKHIAFVSTRDGNQELYTALSDGSQIRRLTTDPGLDRNPCWSQDAKSLYFSTNRWGNLELARLSFGDLVVTRLTHNPTLDDFPTLSPDGKRLAFVSLRSGNYDIYTLDLATGTAKNETQAPSLENFPTWSPTGELTFVSNWTGEFEIYRIPQSKTPR